MRSFEILYLYEKRNVGSNKFHLNRVRCCSGQLHCMDAALQFLYPIRRGFGEPVAYFVAF